MARKSFEHLRHSALLFLEFLASTRRANLEPLASKVSAMVSKIITEAQKLPSVSASSQLAILHAVNAAGRMQLMLPSAAERLVSFLADASCSDLPPALIKSALINLADSSSLQPHLWPHMLNAFAALPAANSGSAAPQLSHALARLSSSWVAAGSPVSWSSGLHVPSAAALLSKLFLSIMCCPTHTSSGVVMTDVLSALLHSLNNLSHLLSGNAREVIRSHILSIPLTPLSGSASATRLPASPNPSPVTPLSPVPTLSFSNFMASLPCNPADQAVPVYVHEAYVRLWGSVVAAVGSSGFAQQACDALCAFATAQKTGNRRSAEDEIVACLYMLSATAQLLITPACCRCILDCCFDVGISSPSRRVQTAAHEAFIAAAKLDHNEASSSLQRHVELPTKSLLKNFLTMVDRAGGGKGTKKAQGEQGRIIAFSMQICGRIISDGSVDASLVARTHALCGTYVMPLLERDMTRGDAPAILQAAKAIVGFVEAQGKNTEWMINDGRDSGGAVMWNFPYSLTPLLNLVNVASGIIVKLVSDKSANAKSKEVLQKEQGASGTDAVSSLASLPVSWSAAAAAAAAVTVTAAASPPLNDASTISANSAATLGQAVVAVVDAARALCSRSNSRSSSVVHSIALQFVRICSIGDVLWRALDESATERLLHSMTSFLCDVVSLGGRNVELSIARAVADAGAILASPIRVMMMLRRFCCSHVSRTDAWRCSGYYVVIRIIFRLSDSFSSVYLYWAAVPVPLQVKQGAL